MSKNSVKNLYMTSLPENLEGKYHILYPISHSEKCFVYLLSDESAGDGKAVVKVLYADRHTKKLVEALSNLSCEYILKPKDFFVKDNLIYVLYDYHKPLTELITDNSLYLKDILYIGIDMCKALLYLHKNNIFHFDISAGNIFQSLNYDIENGNYLLGDYSNAILFSSNREMANDISKFKDDKIVCDGRLLVTFLLTLLNKGEAVTEINGTMIDNLPERVLSVFYITDINFENENKILEKLCEDLSEIKDCDDVLNSNYFIKIEEKNHDLITAKTIPIEIKDEGKNDDEDIHAEIKVNIKANIKKYIPYIALLICGLVFIVSFYNFVIRDIKNKNNVEYISESDKKIDNKDEDKNKDFVCDISDMQIKSFSENIFLQNKHENKYNDLSDITILYAHSNNIRSLIGIGGCVNIKELYLYDNKLNDITDINKLEKLEVLVLSNNNIGDIEVLKGLKSLVFLDLSGNSGLKNVHVLSGLSELEILILSDTGITKDEIDLLRQKLPDCEVIG